MGRPHTTRGGLVLCIENRMIQIALYGVENDRVPLDEVGWRAYAASLDDPLIHDIITRSEPVTPSELQSNHAGSPRALWGAGFDSSPCLSQTVATMVSTMCGVGRMIIIRIIMMRWPLPVPMQSCGMLQYPTKCPSTTK